MQSRQTAKASAGAFRPQAVVPLQGRAVPGSSSQPSTAHPVFAQLDTLRCLNPDLSCSIRCVNNCLLFRASRVLGTPDHAHCRSALWRSGNQDFQTHPCDVQIFIQRARGVRWLYPVWCKSWADAGKKQGLRALWDYAPHLSGLRQRRWNRDPSYVARRMHESGHK